jgi:hypothetical protein
VRLPSGQRYWTVLDEDLQAVAVADEFLRYQRFGRDGAESTTKAYAQGDCCIKRSPVILTVNLTAGAAAEGPSRASLGAYAGGTCV